MRIIVASQEDPVARGVVRRLGPGEPTALRVGDSELRRVEGELYLLERAPLHIHDAALAGELPVEVATRTEALIFPSVHRSATDRPALTVHPLGNLTSEAEVGGRPRELNPVPAQLMTEAFLHLHDEGRKLGIEVTFEATHHGPWLPLPSFFVEIGSTPQEWEREDLLDAVTRVLRATRGERTRGDVRAVAMGGGHYLPRFRDLVRQRRLSVGHLVPSHHASALDEEMREQIVARSLGCEGVVYARGADAEAHPFERWLPKLSEKEIPPR